jgi:hypothetical protein
MEQATNNASATQQAEDILSKEQPKTAGATRRFVQKVAANKTQIAIGTLGTIGGLYALGKLAQAGYTMYKGTKAATADAAAGSM